jgi:hypothetical protein
LRNFSKELDHDPASVVTAMDGLVEETPFSPVLEQLLITLSRRLPSEEERRTQIIQRRKSRFGKPAAFLLDL